MPRAEGAADAEVKNRKFSSKNTILNLCKCKENWIGDSEARWAAFRGLVAIRETLAADGNAPAIALFSCAQSSYFLRSFCSFAAIPLSSCQATSLLPPALPVTSSDEPTNESGSYRCLPGRCSGLDPEVTFQPLLCSAEPAHCFGRRG
jgi:hypothetical protein